MITKLKIKIEFVSYKLFYFHLLFQSMTQNYKNQQTETKHGVSFHLFLQYIILKGIHC